MADFALQPTPPLGGFDREVGGVRIRERHDLAMVAIAVPLGGEEALAAALKSGWSIEPPSPTRSTSAGEVTAIRMTQDQIMLVFSHDGPDAERAVRERLGAAGYATDQTHGWVILEASGPAVLPALERICPIDLHEEVFPAGAAARTAMEHLAAMILRLGLERFLLFSASSSAGSFLHAVETSCRYIAE